ncbi:hypothetical protein F5I97DRAFT_1965764 [Phlebopus sp. FC_14]|nr:hypothetical protein F5I97DRAFT_1965764 [Phlebopus sp. FC_14]
MLSVRRIGAPLDTDRQNISKTPARALVKSRNALQENATRNAPATVVGNRKKVAVNTPFQLKETRTVAKQGGTTKLKDAPAVRPLGDKTPFPNRTANRVTPPETGEKISKPALSGGSIRPSSARKHVRLPRSAAKDFETPVTRGPHWDLSDVDIEVGNTAVNESIEEEDYSEIEYMPPKVEEIPYEPPFEMPDYKEVGKTLYALMQSFPVSDDPPISSEMSFTLHESEKDFFANVELPLPPLEDDSPFAPVKSEAKSKSSNLNAQTRKATTTSRPPQRTAVRQITSTTRAAAAPSARAPSITRLPSVSSTTRAPASTTRPVVSKPTTRTPVLQLTARAPVSKATTRPPSAARSTPSTRVGTLAPPRPATSATTRTASGRMITSKNTTVPTSKTTTLAPARMNTITKVVSSSNSRGTVPRDNNGLEKAKKDLEGLIVFDDAACEIEDFLFDV